MKEGGMESLNKYPIPKSNRPKTAHPFQKHNKSNQLSSKSLIENSKQNNFDVSDLIDQIQQKGEAEAIKPILKDEANQVELITHHKDKLTSINLIEANKEELYEWRTLFNHSRPLSAYTRLHSAKGSSMAPQREEPTIQERMVQQNPVALIDAPNEAIASYIANYEPNNTSSIKKESCLLRHSSNKHMSEVNQQLASQVNCSIIRPKSMYSARGKLETFYFSKDFSDYYNEELKSFAKKMPLVKAKVYVDRTKLNKAMFIIRSQSARKESNLKAIRDNNELVIYDHDVALAGNSGNSIPLLESIYLQLHPDYVDDVQKKKFYKNTAKPLGSHTNSENYAVNCRDMHRSQIKAMREGLVKRKTAQSGIEYHCYDENDPSVRMFLKLIANASERKMSAIVELKEEEKKEFEETVEVVKADHLEEDNQTDRSTIKKAIRPKTGFLRQDISILKKKILSKGKNRPLSSSSNGRGYMNIGYNPNCIIADVHPSKRHYGDISSITGSQRNTCDNSLIACEFIPVKCLPTKTSSLIQNKTYQKINQSLKNKREESKHKALNPPNEYLRCNSSAIEIRPQSSHLSQGRSYREKAAQNSAAFDKDAGPDYERIKKGLTGSKNANWMKVNLIYFNDYIDSNVQTDRVNPVRQEESNVMNPVNYFNKNAKAYYAKKNKGPTFSQVNSMKSIKKKKSLSYKKND